MSLVVHSVKPKKKKRTIFSSSSSSSFFVPLFPQNFEQARKRAHRGRGLKGLTVCRGKGDYSNVDRRLPFERVARSGREDVRCNTASYTPLLRNNCCVCTVAYTRLFNWATVVQPADCFLGSLSSLSTDEEEIGIEIGFGIGVSPRGSNTSVWPTRWSDSRRRENRWWRQWIEVLWGGTKRASLLI